MPEHKVATQDEWQAERDELLVEEKKLTHRNDELTKMRQELPWVRIDKEYRFDTEEGSVMLADLFRGRSQLLIYHFICQNKMKQMAKGIYKWTSTQLRIWNEVATIFLFAIVFLAVLKNAISWIYGIVGLVLLTMILMSAVKIYRYYRMKK